MLVGVSDKDGPDRCVRIITDGDPFIITCDSQEEARLLASSIIRLGRDAGVPVRPDTTEI